MFKMFIAANFPLYSGNPLSVCPPLFGFRQLPLITEPTTMQNNYRLSIDAIAESLVFCAYTVSFNDGEAKNCL